MSSFSGYKTTAFKETQKFFVLDPATGSPSFVQGSDLVSYLRPSLNSVDVETTTDAAVNADYDVGKVIQTTGESAPGDGNPGLFLVVAAGTGGIPMLNGNELLVLVGANTALGISYDNTASGYSATNVQEAIDNFAVNTAGEGSDLIAHTGTSDTVTEALDKRTIFRETIAEIEALSLPVGYNVYLTEDGRAGDFVFNASDLSTSVSADTQQAFYIAPSSDPTGASGAWVRSIESEALLSWSGAADGGSNSTAVQELLNFCSGKPYIAVLDVNSELSGISIPSDVEVHLRANITMPGAGSTDCFTITDKSNVILIGNRKKGYSLTKAGTAKAFQIDATSDYGNTNIKVRGWEVTGGTGQGVNWYGCDDIEFSDNHFHDFNATGFQSTSNLVSNPYLSRKVRFKGNIVTDLLEGGTGNTCHGISINSWLYVDDVLITQNTVKNTSNNPIEIWANYVFCTSNNVEDGAIPLSFGACHYLHCIGNTVNITSPATTGPGAYGVEAGGVVHYTISNNLIRGCRNGIRTTSSNVTGGSRWYTGTDLLSEAGTLDPTSTEKLRILNSDLSGSLQGAYIGVITNNVIEDSLNAGIYAAQDYYLNDAVLIQGNKINRVGRYDTPTDILGAIYLFNCKGYVSDNVVYDSIYYGVYASNGYAVLGPNWFDIIDTTEIIDHVGLASGIKFLSRQYIERSNIADIVAAATPTKGTWQVGDRLYNHAPSAGGTEGIVCTTAGTNSAQLNTRTADTINGSTTVTLSANVGDAQIGVYITIAGVSGVKKIVDVDPASSTIEIDVAADATVSGAAVSNSPAVFKAFGTIAA